VSAPTATANHGYGPYTRGCRCEICCTAKREYQRTFRNNWRARRNRQVALGAGGRNLIDGITHGYAGYTEYSCRCAVCSAAKLAACQRARAANPGPIGSSAAGSVPPD